MYKQIIALIIVTFIVVLLHSFFTTVLHRWLDIYQWISAQLTSIFSTSYIGDVIRQAIAYLIIPFVVGIMVAFIYWLIKKRFCPDFITVVCVLWLIQTSAILVYA